MEPGAVLGDRVAWSISIHHHPTLHPTPNQYRVTIATDVWEDDYQRKAIDRLRKLTREILARAEEQKILKPRDHSTGA